MKEFLRWMQAGLAGLAIQVLAYFQGGNPLTIATVGKIVIAAVLVRAAGWVTQKYGPTPTP